MGGLLVRGTEVSFTSRSPFFLFLFFFQLLYCTNLLSACFSVSTGEIEDAPAPNHLNTFEVYEKDGAVYIKGEEGAIKAGQRDPNLKCTVASTEEKIVVIGGYVYLLLFLFSHDAYKTHSGSGTLGVVQTLRELKFKGSITVLTKEGNLPLDRTKLSKALISDPKKIEIRPAEWYQAAGIDIVHDEVTAVDFASKTVTAKSGKTWPYTKLVLATGGTPRSLPLEGFKTLGYIFLLRDVTDVQAILSALGSGDKKKVVVVGSSFIGMEAGNALSKDHDVSIIGMEKAPLERVMGEQVGKIFQRNVEKSGVKFYLNTSVDKATPSAADPTKVGAVHLKDGTQLDADVVVLGIGVRPATDYLQNNAAVSLEKDGSLRTDESFVVQGLGDVYAIGDIATYPYHGPGAPADTGIPVRIEHWNVAQNAGRSVARAITHSLVSSSPLKLKPFIPVFWSALGAQLRYCGNTTAGWDSLTLQGEPENAKFVAYYSKGETVVAVASMGMDPLMVKSSELMRRGNMPSKKEIEGGVDLLKVDVPKYIAI